MAPNEATMAPRLLMALQLAAAATAQQPPLCNIADLFSHLTAITGDADCRAGCAGGTGVCEHGENWYPSRADSCNAPCGRVYEPCWDMTD